MFTVLMIALLTFVVACVAAYYKEPNERAIAMSVASIALTVALFAWSILAWREEHTIFSVILFLLFFPFIGTRISLTRCALNRL